MLHPPFLHLVNITLITQCLVALFLRSRSETLVASPLSYGSLTEVSTFLQLYIKTSFPSIFSPSLALTFAVILPIELLSSAYDGICFKYHRTF